MRPSFFILDIDECQLSNICNQSCINTGGSYYCDCESGYQLTTDNSTCRGKQLKLD